MKSPFYQTHECEGLQETVASLKQQLSEALESKNVDPVIGHELHTEIENTVQAQVLCYVDPSLVWISFLKSSNLIMNIPGVYFACCRCMR